MNNSLLEVIVLLAPLILGAVIARVYPLPIKNFQAMYLILGAAWIGIHTYFFSHVSLIIPIVILIVGELFLFLMMGLIGTKLGSANYASFLVGAGLFPWYFGVTASLLYIMTALLTSALLAWVKFKWALRTSPVKSNRIDVLKKNLTDEEYTAFSQKASVIFSLPIAFSAFVIVALLY